MVDARATLDALVRERGEDYASLSRLIGRNPAYIQQFIKRGSPQRLAEEDRRVLAAYFGVAESALGGPEAPSSNRALTAETPGARKRAELVLIPRLDVGASAGPGATAGDERADSRLAFKTAWLRELTPNGFAGLSMIRVQGDLMVPTLADSDDILVDRGDGADRLRDGIYVLRIDDALIVKRLAVDPVRRRFTIRSDNRDYPDWAECDPAEIEIIGRVIWAGRKIA